MNPHQELNRHVFSQDEHGIFWKNGYLLATFSPLEHSTLLSYSKHKIPTLKSRKLETIGDLNVVKSH